jgi:hypothetical protein
MHVTMQGTLGLQNALGLPDSKVIRLLVFGDIRRFYNVPESLNGSLAMVLLSLLMLVVEAVRDNGLFLRERFNIPTTSSDEDSSSWYFAQGL